MKTAIKLVLIYFLMQIVGALFAGPFCLLYTYFAYGTFDMDKAGQIAVAPTMLLGFVFMGLYLWRKNYLTGDKHLYSPVSVPYLAWSLLAGMTSICIIGLLMSELTFLPNLLDQTFDILQSGWLGILCISVLGPVLEELLFRGIIQGQLLQTMWGQKTWTCLSMSNFLTSLLFALAHLATHSIFWSVLVFVPSLCFGFARERFGSAYPGIALHAFYNAGYFLLIDGATLLNSRSMPHL